MVREVIGGLLKTSTIVEVSGDMSEADVLEEEEEFRYSCGRQQEFGARRRRSIGRLHRGRAWKAMRLGTAEDYFRERIGLKQAGWRRIVQNDKTERELASRLHHFEKEFVRDAFLEALRDYTQGERLIIAQTLQKRKRFFTQKEVTKVAAELEFVPTKRRTLTAVLHTPGGGVIKAKFDEDETERIIQTAEAEGLEPGEVVRTATNAHTASRARA